MGKVRHVELTARAEQVACSEELGSWRDSVTINRAYDRQVGLNLGIVLIFAPWPFLMMAYDAAPWRDLGGVNATHQASWSGFLASGIAGLAFLALAILAVLWFVQRARVGGAVMHFFDHGAIAERLRGKLAVFRYAEVSPQHVVWDEPMDQGIRKRVQLWIRLPESGYLLCLDGMKKDDRATVRTIAAALDLPPEPEPIGRLCKQAPPAF